MRHFCASGGRAGVIGAGCLAEVVPTSASERHHNPPMDRDVLARLKELKWRSRMTWRAFYAWLLPVVEAAWEKRERGQPLGLHEEQAGQQYADQDDAGHPPAPVHR